MADVATVQDNWSQGMRRDHARDQLPPNTAWNAVDYVLNYGAALRQRGAWKHHSNDISAVTATASYVKAGIYAVLATSAGEANPKNLAIDEDGRLYSIAEAGTVTDLGLAGPLLQNPVFHGGAAAAAATPQFTGLVIIPGRTSLGAADTPMFYDGTTLDDLGGTPPKARFACVYKDYTVLGNGKTTFGGFGEREFGHRVWFSNPGDPDCSEGGSWDRDNSFLDFSQPVRAFGVTPNALLVFGDTQVSRIRGSTPPPDMDMAVDDPWLQIGSFGFTNNGAAFAVVQHADNVYWCAPEGVFRSDGVIHDDLTKKGGMLRYWRDLVGTGDDQWTFAAGVIRDHLLVSITDGGTFVDAFLIDLHSHVWLRLSNIDAITFWSGQLSGADELYWGRKTAPRVCKTDTIFSKVGDSSHASDDDGNAVLPVLETGFYEFGRPGLKRIKTVFPSYELTDHASANPTASVSFVTTPEETSYTATTPDLAETTTYKRVRRPIGRQAPGVAVKITRTGAGDFLFHDLGFDVHGLEPSRVS